MLLLVFSDDSVIYCWHEAHAAIIAAAAVIAVLLSPKHGCSKHMLPICTALLLVQLPCEHTSTLRSRSASLMSSVVSFVRFACFANLSASCESWCEQHAAEAPAQP
jgi:hypothetical protein